MWHHHGGTKNSCIPVKAYLLLVITAIPAVNLAPGGHGRKISSKKVSLKFKTVLKKFLKSF